MRRFPAEARGADPGKENRGESFGYHWIDIEQLLLYKTASGLLES